MSLTQEQIVVANPVCDVIKQTVLSAFTFLSALSLRDVITKTLEAFVTEGAKERLVFIYFYAALVILVTVVLAFVWENSCDE
jgi:uncharacterized membrane protein